MDFKKILFISIFLLAILSIGAVSAAEDVDSDAIAVNDIDADINEDIVQEVEEDAALGAVDEEPVSVEDAEIDVTPVDSENNNITYNEDKNMTIQLKSGGAVVENPTGSIIIEENDNPIFNGSFVNGVVTFSLQNLTANYHVFKIKYNGTDYNADPYEKYGIYVYPIVNIPPSVTVGEDKYIKIEADPASTGEVHFILNGVTKKISTVVNGNASYSLKDWDDYGVVEIDILYRVEGNNLRQSFSLDIAPVNPKLVVSDVKMYYYDGTKLSVKVYGANGKLAEYGEVTIKIGKKTYYAETNTKGVAYLTVKELPGKYSVVIKYEDNDGHKASITKSLVVKKVLTLKTATVKKSAKKLVLSATLKKGTKPISGKRITFKFNGKTYKATTSKKGIAKVTVKKAVLKKLKVGKKVKYQATYEKCVVKKTAKVKK